MLRGQSGFTKTAEHPYKKEVHHTAGCLLPLVLCPDSILKLKMASGYGKRRRSLIHPGFIAAGCTVFQMTTEWQTLLMGTGNTNTKCSSFGQKGEAAINRGPALHLGTCKNCKFPGYAVGTTPTLHHTADWSCSQVTRVPSRAWKNTQWESDLRHYCPIHVKTKIQWDFEEDPQRP